MQSLIVTGGAGFIGSNFVRAALEQLAARVMVVDKLTYAGHPENLEALADHPRYAFLQADIADRAAMDALLARERPDAVVNFAAETHVDRSIDDAAPFVATNVAGTTVLLDAARHYWDGLTGAARAGFRFLHVSTDEVYGTLGAAGRFSETTPYAPNSPYAASKAAADHFVRAWHVTYGLPTLVTHCSNNYGPFQYPEKLIPLMTLNALEARSLPIYGDGGHVRDWLYVADHCEGILRALADGRPGRRYNLGGSAERTNLQVVDTLCEVLERLRPAARNPALRARGLDRYEALKTFVADRPGHDRRYAIDAGRAREELGWRPRHGFAEGLEQTVRWYLEHRGWCEAVQAGGDARARVGLGTG